MKKWLDQNRTLACVFLVFVSILGAWLVGMFEGESSAKEITRLDLLLSFFGLMIFCAALVGVVALIARARKPMTSDQSAAWESVRSKGKWSYVRNSTIRGSAMILVTMVILALIDFSQGTLVNNLKIYIVLSLGIMGCVIYAAIRSWGYYESEYHSQHSSTRQNNPLPEGRD